MKTPQLLLGSFLLLALYSSSVDAAWTLVWSDEFNATALDTKNWEYDSGCHDVGQTDLQCYTSNRDKNVRTSNGSLIIDVEVEEWEDKHFTSGRIHSVQGWTYGKFEVRARTAAGHHLWNALWMYPLELKYGGWAASGQIDMVGVSGDKPSELRSAIHYGGAWPNNAYQGMEPKTFATNDFSKDFHVFALEWDHNELRWLLDDKQYFSVGINRMMWGGRGENPYTKNGQPFDQKFGFHFNVEVGGQVFGEGPFVTPEEAKKWTKNTLEIDYVRVYENK